MPSFAILRLSKHKTSGTIRAASSHMLRTVPTPNADTSKTSENIPIIGTDGQTPADTVEAKLDEIERRRGKPHGKNRVQAVEVLMTASPEWWQNATPDQQAEWRTTSTAWLQKTFGHANVVSLIEHRDETSPHITGFIVPEDPESGRLNAGRWLDGRVKLQKLQDGYAEAVAGLGLDRGVQGSKAKHQRVSRHYANINKLFEAEPNIPAPQPKGWLEDKDEWAEKQRERAKDAALRTIQPLKDKALAYEREKARADHAEAELKTARAKADRLRALPLPEVLEALGLEQDPKDKKQWKDAEGRFRITVKGRQFFEHNEGKGGGGAIDLVMRTMGHDFHGANSWLAARFGASAAAKEYSANAVEHSQVAITAAQKNRPPFKAPEKLNEPHARKYLESRALVYDGSLPPDIRTDERGNIAFLMRDSDGRVQGAELKGTGERKFTGLSLGSSRDAHFVATAQNPKASGYTLRICESAIDALSHACLTDTNTQPNGIKIISTSGARGSLTQTLIDLARHAGKILVAYDWDKAGQRAAGLLIEALKTAFPNKEIRNWVPAEEIKHGKDMNDTLMTLRGLRQPDPIAAPTRTKIRNRGMEM